MAHIVCILIDRLVTRISVFLSRLRVWKYVLRGIQIGRHCQIGRDVEMRFPFRIKIGNSCKILGQVRVKSCAKEADGRRITLDISDHVHIGYGCVIIAHSRIVIGRDTLIAPYCFIIDNNHTIDSADVPIRRQGATKAPIHIGEDVWIGAHSVILPGVTIGDHAVIGANSTVTRCIPAGAIAVGSPAKVISYRRGWAEPHEAIVPA